ncbi:MAG: oligoendopeptidase F [bacterium]
MKTSFKLWIWVVISLLLEIQLFDVYSQNVRSEIPGQYKWDLSELYPSYKDWEMSKNKLRNGLKKIEAFKGTLTQNPGSLLDFLNNTHLLKKELVKLYSYAAMLSNLDCHNMKYSGMNQEVVYLFSEFEARLSFSEPEILSMDRQTMEEFIKQEPGLDVNTFYFDKLFLKKGHILSETEERILANSSLLENTPSSVFSAFCHDEMPKPTVILNSGDTVNIGKIDYDVLRQSKNRNDRVKIFEAFWENYSHFKKTYGEILYGGINSKIFLAKARKYNSSLEAALHNQNIPVSVYASLIESTNQNLDVFHRYLKIKKKLLNVDTLHYYDLYAPLKFEVDSGFLYEEAQEIILKALRPLGDEYVSLTEKAFNEKWIDVFPSEEKIPGGYMNGANYDVHPFIFVNFNNTYNDMSTLIHELGHAMHSYYSNETQPYPLAWYEIFTGEVAAILNEVLLYNYIAENTTEDDHSKLIILMRWLDRVKATFFRQAQFAEFEQRVHEAAEGGESLTGADFCRIYKFIADRYYGHDQGICYIDDYIQMEWAYVPHFYSSFYVYQYCTSLAASVTLAESILNNEEGAIERYMTFLKSGGSDFSMELLKTAGVDMSTRGPFEKMLESVNQIMDEIEDILDRQQIEMMATNN